MKIKTANVGGIDVINHCVDVDIYTDPVLDYSNRLSGKYYKTHHDSDVIWLDGSFRIFNKGFHDFVEDQLGDHDFMMTKHPQRNTLGEEYDYILKRLHKPYLNTRYGQQPWLEEMRAFSDGLDAPLFNAAFFALRKNTTDQLMSEWWRLILEYTIFDQSQITYLLYKNKDLKIKMIDWSILRPYVIRVGHKKLI